MKKNFRTSVAALMAGGMILAAAATASAEPAAQTEAPAGIALLGPDRSMRAPQRAVKAPVKRTQRRRQTVVEPPAPPVKPFVYKKRECKTLTDAPFDINGESWTCCDSGPTCYKFDEGRVRLWTPNGHFPVNKLGAMGADREFLNVEYWERLGVWANGRVADQSPKAIVGDMVSRIKAITCGT